MSRSEFLYYPKRSAAKAQTFLLDWNVASRLVSLHGGQRFEGSPATQERILDLGSRFPSGGAAIAGFAAAEPEVRPKPGGQDPERMVNRARIAVEMLERGHDHFPGFLDGSVGPKSIVQVDSEPASRSRIDEFGDIFVRPTYAILLKALALKLGGGSAESRVDRFRFWLRAELEYRPTREVWLGMLLLAGNSKGLALVENMLKLGKALTPDQRFKDIWGASWDIMYTRLVGFSADRGMWPELPRPFVFVTDDAKLYEAFEEVLLIGMARTATGVSAGVDSLRVEGLVEESLSHSVQEAMESLSEVAAAERRTSNRIKSHAVSKAKSEARRLEGEIRRLMKQSTATRAGSWPNA